METEQKLSGKLYLVDLAGSEKVRGPARVKGAGKEAFGVGVAFLEIKITLIELEFSSKVYNSTCLRGCASSPLIPEPFHHLLTVTP